MTQKPSPAPNQKAGEPNAPDTPTSGSTSDTAPRKRDPQARIRAIRHAAAEIIIEHGAAALTHRAVAKQAGVALGTTTKYFSSIDDLRTSALEFLAEQFNDDLAYIEKGITAAEDKVAYMASEAHRFYSDPRNSHIDAAMTFAEIFDDDVSGLGLQWSKRLEDILAPHFGTLRAKTLTVFLDGYIIDTALNGQTMDQATLEQIIRGIAEMPVLGTGGVGAEDNEAKTTTEKAASKAGHNTNNSEAHTNNKEAN